jgi:hypothetical protein
MQSAEEHQEIATEDAAIMPVGEPRKRRRVRYLAAERRRSRRKGPEDIADHGEEWRLPVKDVPTSNSGTAEKKTPLK